MWPHWKEQSIKRFNERRPNQPSACRAVTYALSMPLFTHLVSYSVSYW